MSFEKITEEESIYRHLEKMTIHEILTFINQEDKGVPDAVAGAHTFGGITFLPRSSYGKDVDRVSLRQLLLDSVAALEHLEITQSADEVKVIQGEDGVRTFYPKRDSTGVALDGAKLTRRMRFEGDQLKLDPSAKSQLMIADFKSMTDDVVEELTPHRMMPADLEAIKPLSLLSQKSR
jgi:hypothetical protein